MVKKIKQKTIVPMRHGNVVFNLIFLFQFFLPLFYYYIFFNSTQGTTYIKNILIIK